MKWLSLICCLFGSIHNGTDAKEFTLHPHGKFYYSWLVNTDRPLVCIFSHFSIYDETDGSLYGVVEKSHNQTLYTLKVDEEIVCSCFLENSSYLWLPAVSNNVSLYISLDQENIAGSIIKEADPNYKAVFSFYYENETNRFAYATLSKDTDELNFYNSENKLLLSASLFFTPPISTASGKELQPTITYWTITPRSDEPIDELFFWPFMAFIQDHWTAHT